MAELKQKLGLTAAVAMVLGNIVGVSIFLVPATVASHLPSAGWFIAAWVLGGLLALVGALCLGELGAMLPEAGGDYLYIRRAFGDRPAFLSGWTSVAITFPGSIAAMAVALCFYNLPAFLGPWVTQPALRLSLGSYGHVITWAQVLGIGVLLLLTAVNHVGVRVAGWVQTAITAAPVLLMLVAGVAALFVTPAGPAPAAVVSAAAKSPLAGLWPAIIPIFFAYAGWNVSTYFGGEIEKPGRNLPLSLLLGTSLAIVVYLVMCFVFLRGVPVDAMPSSKIFVPFVAVTRLYGSWAGPVLTGVIALAVLSSINATIFAGARIGYAMAGHGLAFEGLRRLSPRFGTPSTALWVQAGIAIVLVLSGRFDQLVGYVATVMMIFSAITVYAVIQLRRREPGLERPYRVFGYPFTPALFILFSAAVVVAQTRAQPVIVAWGLLITALGLPLYEVMRRRRPA